MRSQTFRDGLDSVVCVASYRKINLRWMRTLKRSLHAGPYLRVQLLVASAAVWVLYAAGWRMRGSVTAVIQLQGEPLSKHLCTLSCRRSSKTTISTQREVTCCQCYRQGMLANAVACVGSSAAIFLAYTLVLVVRTEPWWQARLHLPFCCNS